MGREEIVNKILADADAEAEEILRAARARADEILATAQARADEERAEVEREVQERVRRISDGKAAAARLDSKKIVLAQQRYVLDEIYHRALGKLLNLKERESLKLMERLLTEHAEAGDEVVFAENFAYAKGAAELPVVGKLGLTISKKRADISGGCILLGKKCDKDLSYSAILQADAEEHQAEIAAKLFKMR